MEYLIGFAAGVLVTIAVGVVLYIKHNHVGW